MKGSMARKGLHMMGSMARKWPCLATKPDASCSALRYASEENTRASTTCFMTNSKGLNPIGFVYDKAGTTGISGAYLALVLRSNQTKQAICIRRLFIHLALCKMLRTRSYRIRTCPAHMPLKVFISSALKQAILN